MESAALLSFARARTPLWQDLLCQSVLLYLALGEPSLPVPNVEAALRRVEAQLIWRLLQGQELDPNAVTEAWAIVETAQARLLGSPTDLADCLARCTPAQCLVLVQNSAYN
jgi:hypothetical protein